MTRLNFESIQNLIKNKIKESLNLDYKRELGNHNTEIAKDISSFANASGGKIIYGVDEKNELPHSINWINTKGVKEKIESIILSNIQPEIKGYDIYSIENPDNQSQAIFVVDIPESSDAPHMANHRYYIRRNFKSEYMEDSEVKNSIFRKGLKKSLEYEVKQNLEMMGKILQRLNLYHGQWSPSKERAPILLIPFYTEAWRAMIGSGILFIFKDKATLVEAYNIIHEINYLMDSLRYEKYSYGAFTQVDSTTTRGDFIQRIIIEKTEKVKDILQKIKFE